MLKWIDFASSLLIFKHRKGVSPLIATVLLMAFAVALGAIVMTWGKNYVTESTSNIERSDDKLACSFDVGAEVLTTPGKKAACVDPTNNKITFLLQNKAQKDITKFKITYIDSSNGIDAVEYVEPVGKAEIKKLTPSFNPVNIDKATIQQIILNPIITVDGQETACVDAIDPITDIGVMPNC